MHEMTSQEHKIIQLISEDVAICENSVKKTIELLNGGATIPFIARYRKEATNGLDEIQIQAISEKLSYYNDIAKRKDTIINTISSQGKLNEHLSKQIEECWSNSALEDIYLPFKPKRKTKAEAARAKGLEPLAKIIMAQGNGNIRNSALRFLGSDVKDADEAIQGAKDIIAEWISENKRVRATIRRMFSRTAVISSKVAKGKESDGETYATYFNFQEKLRKSSSHHILAILRGEKDGILKVDVSINTDDAISEINRIIIHGHSEASILVGEAAADSYKRLIKPSIETEFRALAKEKADDTAIDVFAQNVRQLLFAPPLGEKNVIAIDPGFRTGCKVVCLDRLGNLLRHDVIFPTAPRCDEAGASAKLITLAKTFSADAFAIGNGTASRETEKFVRSIDFGKKIPIYVVSENGASIYSASKVAREEFPNEDVTVRGAVSIGRRLIDPLAELVKIDPKSIGVGQYQHDVDQTKLKKALDFVVESCVNSVGVNINTASKELLSYVSGIGPALALNIVNFRKENGNFTSRHDIMNVPRLGAKAFEQCAGFLRIAGGNPLDNSAIHPERYELVKQMAKDCHCTINDLFTDKAKREQIDIKKYITPQLGEPTLIDILKELEKPGRDPRCDIQESAFDDSITSIDDVREGMHLRGIVENITQFGVFVDIGVHISGLVHISELSNHFVKSPSDVVKLGQQVNVSVLQVDRNRKRISLTMKGIKQ